MEELEMADLSKCQRTYCPCDECPYGIEKRDGSGNDSECKICEFAELLNRHATQKNNPMTVTFPCKIGDIIYEVEEGLPITSYYVNGFIIGKTGSEGEEDEAISERHGWQIEYGKPGIDCECPLSEFGKSLFLTRKAAEQALTARKPEGREADGRT